MKKLIVAIMTVALATVLVAQEKALSLADARGKISSVIANPSSAASVMKQLAAGDQAAFLADLNAAIAKMPGSPEEKTSKFVEVDTSALKGAQKGNLTTLVAEVFATVPPESLTAINERFAAGQFNRSADPSKTYTDEQYKQISLAVLDKVQKRNATADNAGVRDTFAILMLIRASNGTPADLRDTLVNALNDANTRNLAQNEWISPALGVGQPKTYDPMLGASDAGSQPNLDMVLVIPFKSAADALVADLAVECSLNDASESITALMNATFSDPNQVDIIDGVNPLSGGGLATVPRSTDFVPYNPEYRRGVKIEKDEPPVGPQPQASWKYAEATGQWIKVITY